MKRSAEGEERCVDGSEICGDFVGAHKGFGKFERVRREGEGRVVEGSGAGVV